MKRLFAVACTSLMFLSGACDDDEKVNWKGDAAVTVPDAGGNTDSGAAVCTGTFMGLTRAQLMAAATGPGGACTSATDVGLLCTGGIGDKVREYGKGCLTGGSTDPLTCVRNATNMNHMDLSAGCRECYIGSVTCTLQKCAASCTPDPNVAACLTCQQTQGCISGFLTCAGVRLGGGTDAGTDATTDGGTDTASDTRPPDTGSDATGSDATGSDATDATADVASDAVDSATD